MKILKKIFVIILVFSVFLGSFWNEYRLVESVQGAVEKSTLLKLSAGQSAQLWRGDQSENIAGPMDFKLIEGDRIQNEHSQSLEVTFGVSGSIYLDATSFFKVLSLPSSQQNLLAFELEKGRAWVNTVFDANPFLLRVGPVSIFPAQALLDVDYHAGKLTVASWDHHALVQLIDPSSAQTNPGILNSFLLTQGNQVTIYDDEIHNNFETLQKLLYSKLIKEFQYGLFDAFTLQKDPWIDQNQQNFRNFKQTVTNERLQLIRQRGLVVNNLTTFAFQFYQSLERLRDAATFDQQKKIEYTVERFFQHIHDAEYLSIVGRSDEAKERLQYFQQLLELNPLKGAAQFQSLFIENLEKEYSFLSFVSPSDPLYMVRTQIADFLLSDYGTTDLDLTKRFLLIRDFLNAAYDFVDQNSQTARNLLEDYYKRFVQFASTQSSNLKKIKNMLAEDNQIMDNLLRQYPQFYRDHIFAMKNNLEPLWLSTIDLVGEKNEIKQTIIGNKIDFLKQLQNFFLADKIAVVDARQIVFRLFREADQLQLSPDAEVAVSELFAKRLQDFGIFFRFLNSSEYVNTTLHGVNHREQFQQFLQLQQAQTQVNIEDVRKEILDGTSTQSPTSIPTSVTETPPVIQDNVPTPETLPVKIPVKRKK